MLGDRVPVALRHREEEAEDEPAELAVAHADGLRVPVTVVLELLLRLTVEQLVGVVVELTDLDCVTVLVSEGEPVDDVLSEEVRLSTLLLVTDTHPEALTDAEAVSLKVKV